MSTARDIRRSALQVLYQYAAGNVDAEVVRASLVDSAGNAAAHDAGFHLANEAWAHREEADAAISQLTPDWPTHRQPVVDRSILRLAYYEMSDERTPPKVVINEAVELAKEFSTEKSPLFINGVLDKLYRNMRGDDAADDASDPVVEADPDPDPDVRSSEPGETSAPAGT